MRNGARWLGAALLGAASHSVAAQQLAAADGADESAIIVYGQKLARDPIDLPVSVSVLDQEEIARRPAADLYELLERLPNVAESFGGQGFNIRGIDQRGVSGAGNGQTLSVFVDDAVLSNRQTFFGPLDVWDLEQVEVYRGPVATTFGRNALAGAIYLRTADPTFDLTARARAEAAEFGVWQVAGAAGGGLVPDRLAVRISANHRESDGFIRNSFLNRNADAFEQTTVRGKVLWKPADSVSLLASGVWNRTFGGEDGLPAVNPLDRRVAYDFPGREGNETWLGTARLTVEIARGLHLVAVATHQTADYLRQEDFDGSPRPGATLDRTGDERFTTQEVRFEIDRGPVRGVIGGFHLTTRDAFDDAFQVPITFIDPRLPLTNFISRVGMFEGRAENWAAFADAEVRVAGPLRVIAGFRYDRETTNETTDTVTRILGVLPPRFEPLRRVVETDVDESLGASFEAFLPRAGLRLDLGDHSVGFVASRGYRAGGAQFNLATGAANRFDPEFLWNYELSAKGRIGDRLTYAINGFYADWTDQQVAVPAAPGLANVFITVNAGESRLFGFEAETSWAVAPDWDATVAVGYVDTAFTDFVNADPAPGEPDDFRGNRFPFAARWTGSAALSWRPERGPFASAAVLWRSGYFSDAANLEENRVGGRALVDLQAGWRWRAFTLTAFARNLLDRDYLTFRNTAGQGLARAGAPRLAGVRADIAL